MDAIEAIMTRRSIREYTDEPVTAAQIQMLLECAMNAPSACNQQSWRFVVLTDRKLMDSVPSVHPNCHMIRSAPAAILVCGDTEDLTADGFWPQDCAAAIENLLLAAHALGLGAVWTGIYPVEARTRAVQRLLGLPANIVPLAMIPVGHPKEEPAPVKRFDPKRVHQNGW